MVCVCPRFLVVCSCVLMTSKGVVMPAATPPATDPATALMTAASMLLCLPTVSTCKCQAFRLAFTRILRQYGVPPYSPLCKGYMQTAGFTWF